MKRNSEVSVTTVTILTSLSCVHFFMILHPAEVTSVFVKERKSGEKLRVLGNDYLCAKDILLICEIVLFSLTCFLFPIFTEDAAMVFWSIASAYISQTFPLVSMESNCKETHRIVTGFNRRTKSLRKTWCVWLHGSSKCFGIWK